MQRLLKAAQTRKLDRVTAVYAVAGWILVQGASILLPTFDAPVWALRVFIAAIFTGLPVALAIAWTMAPPPLRRKGNVPVQTTRTDLALVALLGAVVLLSVAQFAYEFLREQVTLRPATPASGVSVPAEASIAVLPFVNMSDDASKEYFSDGISEELLNDLAQVPGLRVAGRTSSFSFKGKSATDEDIGRALNVRTVLEGSVRREENRVRITAQLINVLDGYHIWSQTYDRQLADILAVQDEIARTITHELTGRLLGSNSAGKAKSARPAIDPGAYTAYLQGRFFLNKRNKDDMLRAVDFFHQALKLEPNYVDAHASLGRTYTLLYANGQKRDVWVAAKDETAAALRLDPNNLQALVTKGLIAEASWNWRETETAFRRAMKLNPNDADAQHFYAVFLADMGLPEAAIAPGRRASVLDPLSPIMVSSLGDYFRYLKRNTEAASQYQAALILDPNFVSTWAALSMVDVDIGKFDEAKTILRDHILPVSGERGPYFNFCQAFIAARTGDFPELKRLAKNAPQYYASGDVAASVVAWIYAQSGDFGESIHWFEKAYDDRDPNSFGVVTIPQLPAKLKSDPRWSAFMRRPLMMQWQAAHDRLAAELAASK